MCFLRRENEEWWYWGFLCIYFFPSQTRTIKCSSLWWNSHRLQEVSVFAGVSLWASPSPTLHLFLSAWNPDSCADTGLALALLVNPLASWTGLIEGGWWGFTICSLLVGLMASTMHNPVCIVQAIFYRSFSPHLPCLMQVVATPKDSNQHGFWTSRWAALWQSRLPVCLAVPEYWNWSRHCPTVCYQRGKTLFSLQHHSISEVELGSLLCIFQAI